MEQMVTITKKEFDSLTEDSIKLSCLENAGVDNWAWYDEAMTEFREIMGEDND